MDTRSMFRRPAAGAESSRPLARAGMGTVMVLAAGLALPALPLVSAPDGGGQPRGGLAANRSVDVAETHDGAIVSGEEQPGGPVVVHRAGGTALARQPVWADSFTTRSISVELGAWEPTIGVDAAGTVYAQIYGDDAVPSVARSTDEGATWQVIRPALQATDVTLSHDPYLHVDTGTGRVFTANLTSGPGVCHEIQHTDDGGVSWTSTALCGGGDHQTLFTGPPVTSAPTGYPHLVYYCVGNGGAGATFSLHTSCFVSRDGGVVFVPSGDQAFLGVDPEVEQGQFGLPGFCDALPGHGTVGADGTVYLPRVHCDRPMLAISHDEGATWERAQVGPAGTAITDYGYHSHDAGIVADPAGNLYYTWVARDRLPYLVTSTDGGRTWSQPLMVAHPDVVEANLPGAIELVAPGRVALAYVGSEDSPGPPFPELLDCTFDLLGCADRALDQTNNPSEYDGVTWNGYVTVVDGVPGEDPVLLSTRITPDDHPLVSGDCGPFRCKGMGDFMDVTVAPDGDVWGVFVDVCAHDADGPGGVDACEDMYGRLSLGVLDGAGSSMTHCPTLPEAFRRPHPTCKGGSGASPPPGRTLPVDLRSATDVPPPR